MARLLLADCQPLFNEALAALLVEGTDHEVVACSSSSEDIVRQTARIRPELILVDASLALAGPASLLAKLLAFEPEPKVLLLANEVAVETAAEAVRGGAQGVIAKTSSAVAIRRTVEAVLRGEAAVPRALLPKIFRQLSASQRQAAASPVNRLSARERQVLVLLGKGWDNTRIGQELFISPNTVRTHVQNILEKLGMHSKLEAATFAMQRPIELLPHL